MAQSGIRVTVRNNLGVVESNLNRNVDRCLILLGRFLVSQAKLRCPVDIGYLRGSIGSKVERFRVFKKKLVIYARAEYAGYVHEGTRRMRPRRFLYDAVRENMSRIRSFIRQELRRGF